MRKQLKEQQTKHIEEINENEKVRLMSVIR